MYMVRYLLGIRNRLEENVRKSFGSLLPGAANPDIRDSDYNDFDDGDMSRLKDMGSNIDPNWDYTDVRTKPTREDDREREDFQFTGERDASDWMNPYAQQERERIEDYAWGIQFYEYASSGDQFW